MGRIVGIDYGQKRTGLAATDPEQRIAGVLTTVATHELYQFLEKYVASESVEGFVVGFPRQMNFQPSESAQYVQAFVKGLKKKFPEIPVYWMDERFTSKMAMQSLIDSGASKSARKDKGTIDAVSAAIILESWLQKRNFESIMILPVYAYGSPVLKKIAEDIPLDYPGLEQLITDMFDTMKVSDGVGLAAPQIGVSARLFVMDARIYADEDPSLKDFRKVFINPHILEAGGEEVLMQEGCLSVPNIHEDILRPEKIRIQYVDENLISHEEWYEGMAARIIQHEYDHLDGILFPDRLSPLKKRLMKGKLRDITQGKTSVRYKMVFPQKK